MRPNYLARGYQGLHVKQANKKKHNRRLSDKQSAKNDIVGITTDDFLVWYSSTLINLFLIIPCDVLQSCVKKLEPYFDHRLNLFDSLKRSKGGKSNQFCIEQ